MKLEAIDFGCGCRAVPLHPAAPARWTMEHCRLHKAAPELLAACEAVIDFQANGFRACHAAVAKARETDR